jgi:hypothetical protein
MHVDAGVRINLGMRWPPGGNVVAQTIGQAPQRCNMHTPVCQLQVCQRRWRRLAALQGQHEAAGLELFFDSHQAVWTFRVAGAHLVQQTIIMKKVTSVLQCELAIQEIQLTSSHGSTTHAQNTFGPA